MSNVYIISDHHFGHQKIFEFESSRQGSNIADHDEWLIEQHNSVVAKRDTVWFLGDVCFGQVMHMHDCVMQMAGTKHLILGNHDDFELAAYEHCFDSVHGIKPYKGKKVFSHVPLHNNSLDRWKFNFHGHTHSQEPFSDQHINCCVERCDGVPRTIMQWLDGRS